MIKKFAKLFAALGLLVALSSCAADTNYEFGVGVVAEEAVAAEEVSVGFTSATVVFNSKGRVVDVDFNLFSVPFFVNGGEIALGEKGEETYTFEKLLTPEVAGEVKEYVLGMTVEQIVSRLTDDGLLGNIEVPVFYYVEAISLAWDNRLAEVDYSVFGRSRVGTNLTLSTYASLDVSESALSLLSAAVATNVNDRIVVSHLSSTSIGLSLVDGLINVGLAEATVTKDYLAFAHWTVGKDAEEFEVDETLEVESDLSNELVAFNHALTGLANAQVFAVPAVVVPELPVEEPVEETPEEETTEPETEEPVDEEETTEPVEETPEEETEEPVTEEPSDEEDSVEETPVDEEETTEEEPANP